MSAYNQITVVGRAVADAELRQTQDGTQVTSFRIAVNRQGSKKDANGKSLADFFNVSVWRNQAENAHNFVKKGRLLLVVGPLQLREYTDRDGNKRTSADISASTFQMMDPKPADGASNGETHAAPVQAQAGNGHPPQRARAQAAPAATAEPAQPDYEYSDADEEVPF